MLTVALVVLLQWPTYQLTVTIVKLVCEETVEQHFLTLGSWPHVGAPGIQMGWGMKCQYNRLQVGTADHDKDQSLRLWVILELCFVDRLSPWRTTRSNRVPDEAALELCVFRSVLLPWAKSTVCYTLSTFGENWSLKLIVYLCNTSPLHQVPKQESDLQHSPTETQIC